MRYVPDQEPLKGPKAAILEYATYPEGLRARAVTGRINVTINPLPDAVKYPNQPPSARSFSASVTAGDTLAITVPTSGVDPDGDLTFVSGIVGEDGKAVDLKLGPRASASARRRSATRPTRAARAPRSSATSCATASALTSEGFVRVGVVQPGDPQPPVAVEDDVVAAPGRTVHADVLSNDLIAAGDSVSFVDLSTLNDADVLKDFQRQKDDTFKVVAPEDGPGQGAHLRHHGRPLRPVEVDADGARPEGLQQPADRGRRHGHRQAGRDLDPRRRARQRPRPRRRPGEPQDHEVHR